MKYTLSFVFTFLFVPQVLAQNEFANIYHENVRISGSIGIGHSTYSKTIVSINPRVSYFFWDRVALGIAADYLGSENNSTLIAGPTFTWFFWHSEKWAAAFDQQFAVNARKNYEDEWESNSSLELHYFIFPQVSFGPKLTYNTELGKNRATANDSWLLLGTFSIFF